MKYIQYKHHGEYVFVRDDLFDRHKEYCLCYKCQKFKPKEDNINCEIAKSLFKLDCRYHIVTPVWECKKFEEKTKGGK